MKNQIKEIISIIEKLSLFEGVNSTKIDLLSIRKHSFPVTAHSIFKPLFCLNLQGDKVLEVGDEEYRYNQGQYILASADLALTGHVKRVSKDKPFYGVIIDLDPIMIVEVLNEMTLPHSKKSTPKKALSVRDADVKILDAIKRLLGTLDQNENSKILSKLYMKEIIFLLVSNNKDDAILQMGMIGSQFQRIKSSISHIITNYQDKINIDELAQKAAMSSSSFHKYFKDVTGLSPIQFQKKTRLMNARGHIISSSKDIAEIAFEVGYESPSQFSREYSRQFGHSPKEERSNVLE